MADQEAELLTTATAPSLSNHPDRPHDSSFVEGVASAGHDQPSNNNAPQQQPTLSEKDADNFDRDVLHRGVRDAGRWAYGTILVEAGVWNDRGTHMIRPPGWWLDPVFHAQQHEQLKQKVTIGTSAIGSHPQ